MLGHKQFPVFVQKKKNTNLFAKFKTQEATLDVLFKARRLNQLLNASKHSLQLDVSEGVKTCRVRGDITCNAPCLFSGAVQGLFGLTAKQVYTLEKEVWAFTTL